MPSGRIARHLDTGPRGRRRNSASSMIVTPVLRAFSALHPLAPATTIDVLRDTDDDTREALRSPQRRIGASSPASGQNDSQSCHSVSGAGSGRSCSIVRPAAVNSAISPGTRFGKPVVDRLSDNRANAGHARECSTSASEIAATEPKCSASSCALRSPTWRMPSANRTRERLLLAELDRVLEAFDALSPSRPSRRSFPGR